MIDPFNAFSYRAEPVEGDGAANATGPLAGVSVGVKANIAVAGMPFHAGLEAYADRVAERDAEVVTRLRAAGASIAGILNMEEAALGAKTDNPHFGAVINPHRAGYSPGGSSGGSGAAVAASLVDVALGTDTMGSVRIPAAHCCVYGFKPATTRVSQDGLEPADFALDAIGPLARDLDLLETVSRTISDFGEGQIHGRGAVLVDHDVALHPQVGEAWRRAQYALDGGLGKVRLDEKPGRIRFAGFIQVSSVMAGHLTGIATSEHLARLLTFGPQRSDADRMQDAAVLARAREQLREAVASHGFLLLPTVPNPPFPHSEKEPAAQADFTCLANIAGLPALAIPAGWTDDGLPLGIQLVGQEGDEAGLFALARHLDTEMRAYRAPAIQGA